MTTENDQSNEEPFGVRPLSSPTEMRHAIDVDLGDTVLVGETWRKVTAIVLPLSPKHADRDFRFEGLDVTMGFSNDFFLKVATWTRGNAEEPDYFAHERDTTGGVYLPSGSGTINPDGSLTPDDFQESASVTNIREWFEKNSPKPFPVNEVFEIVRDLAETTPFTRKRREVGLNVVFDIQCLDCRAEAVGASNEFAIEEVPHSERCVWVRSQAITGRAVAFVGAELRSGGIPSDSMEAFCTEAGCTWSATGGGANVSTRGGLHQAGTGHKIRIANPHEESNETRHPEADPGR